jgi:NodT family efflux transporter outer membrane factor (OMF) lipoprotein
MTKRLWGQHFENRSAGSLKAPLGDSYVTVTGDPSINNSNPGFTTAYTKQFAATTCFFIVIFVTFLTTGCVVGPDFATPPAPALQLDYLAKQSNHASSNIPINQWWNSFGDPTLNALLQRAEHQNLTLRESYERICEARSNFFLQGGNLRPNGDFVAGYAYNKNSPNSRPFVGQNGDPFNLLNLGFNVSWEIDLFGKIARQIEAAGAELQFQDAEFQFIKQTLFADIAVSYLQIRQLQAQAAVIEQSLLIQAHTSQLVSERQEAGVSTELDTNQTDSFRFRSESILASLKRQLELEFNNLSLLMGQSSDQTLRDFVGVMPMPPMPPVPDVGFPAELLRRRPDVARQEAAVKAASAQIGIAEADLYPQLTLLGNISVASKNLSSLFETNGLEFSVGPGITWNILHFGRINDNIDVQQARFRQAVARYQQTVLSAAREVEDAMINHHGFIEQSRAVARAIEADEKAVELSLQRYRAGKANFQRVIDAQQQLLNDQQQLFELEADAIGELVRLFRAAGGDWIVDGGFAAGQCGSSQNCVSFAPSIIDPSMLQPGVSEIMPEFSRPTTANPALIEATPVDSQSPDFLFGPLDSTPMPATPTSPGAPTSTSPTAPPPASPQSTPEQTWLPQSYGPGSVMLPASTVISPSRQQGYPALGSEVQLPTGSPFDQGGLKSILTPPTYSAPPVPQDGGATQSQALGLWE